MRIIKALILAAGYAVRLYPLTQNTPKPLLEIKGKPIIGHILDKLKSIKDITEVYIITNHRFYDQFRVWLNHYSFPKNIKLIDDGTISNEDRLGAVGDINFVLKEEDIQEDILVLAGDNLFGFSLQKFIDFFQRGKNKNSVLALHDLQDKEKIKGKLGAAVLEKTKIIHFEEKPLQPKSTLAATACYLFARDDLPFVEKSLQLGKVDNPGELIKYLVKESEVHGFVFTEPWLDVGTFESLKQAEQLYS